MVQTIDIRNLPCINIQVDDYINLRREILSMRRKQETGQYTEKRQIS